MAAKAVIENVPVNINNVIMKHLIKFVNHIRSPLFLVYCVRHTNQSMDYYINPPNALFG